MIVFSIHSHINRSQNESKESFLENDESCAATITHLSINRSIAT